MNVTPGLNAKFINKVNILLLVVSSMLVISCKHVEKTFPQITSQEAEEVKNICSNLKPPPSFAKTHQKDSVKSDKALRSIQYSLTADPKEVEEYFVNLLTHSGWSYQKEGFAPGNRLLFRKGKFTIYIGISQFFFYLKQNLFSRLFDWNLVERFECENC
jgi:hypothetical protein